MDDYTTLTVLLFLRKCLIFLCSSPILSFFFSWMPGESTAEYQLLETMAIGSMDVVHCVVQGVYDECFAGACWMHS